MESAAAIERLEQMCTVRSDASASPADLTAALSRAAQLRAFIAAGEADLARRLAAASSFPEAALAESTRDTLSTASKTIERSRILADTPTLADALDDAAVTPAHVDAVTRSAKPLDDDQRRRLLDTVESLVGVATHATVEQFTRRLRTEVGRITSDDGMERLERQRRSTSLSTWVDVEGMWNVRGRFDPVSGVSLNAAFDNTVEQLFAESVPDTCPTDPVEKQKHLRALAFSRLVLGTAGTARRGRPEFVAAIDIAAGPGCGAGCGSDSVAAGSVGSGSVASGLSVDWPIPVEVPAPVLVELIGATDVSAVIVRNGVVLHAPGNLNLGRSTRLANRDQRRALRGLYRSCAVPGCAVSFNRCRLHHITWWRHGGRTDLDNLLPVCSHHHHQIHDAGWKAKLDPQRRLTITFPDGTVRNTGPPRRLAA